METPARAKIEYKMADSRFSTSNQSDIEQLKENSKNQNTLEATQTWLTLQNWVTEWTEVNQKVEEYEHEELDKMWNYWSVCSALLRT